MTLHFGRGRGPGHINRSPQGGNVPSLVLNFLSGTLDPRVTFTRTNATSTRVNASGALELVGANTPRFDYDPNTLALKGLLIEETRTNLFLNSLLNGTNLSTQNVTVSATPYTISFYGTGSITLSGAATATITGTGAYPTRTTYTFTPTAGTLTCTVSGTVQYANCEAGSFATSFIPTAGSTVVRSPDTATMTGANFTSWYNQSQGTLLANFTFAVAQPNFSTLPRFIGAADSAGLTPSSGTAITGYQRVGGTTQMQIALGSSQIGTQKAAMTYGAKDNVALNGAKGSSVSGSTAGSMTSFILGIGTNFFHNATGQVWYRGITYYPQSSSDAQLQALTS